MVDAVLLIVESIAQTVLAVTKVRFRRNGCFITLSKYGSNKRGCVISPQRSSLQRMV